MSYDLSWADAPAPTDERVTDKDVTVLVDRKASLFLIGTVMDYEVKADVRRLHLHQPEREGPLRLRRELPRLTARGGGMLDRPAAPCCLKPGPTV